MVCEKRTLFRKAVLSVALGIFLAVPLAFSLNTQAASGLLYEHTTDFVPGESYVIAAPSIQANGDTQSYSYCISCRPEGDDGLQYVKTPTKNPSDDVLWTINSEEGGKFSLWSVGAKKYMTLKDGKISLTDTKCLLNITQENGSVYIYLNTEQYLRFTNVGTSRWHSGIYPRAFKLYSTTEVYPEYREFETPLMTVAFFSDMHHEYGIQYRSPALRESSLDAVDFINDELGGVDVVVLGGDISGRRTNHAGGETTWTGGDSAIKKMMDDNYNYFAKASKTGKLLAVTGNHDPEPSVHMTPQNGKDYPSVNSNDWSSYMKKNVGSFAASATYADLGLSTADVPSQYRNEVLCYLYKINGIYFLGLNTPFGDRLAIGKGGYNGLYVAQVTWAEQQLKKLGKNTTVLILCHYPLTAMPTVTGPRVNVAEGSSSTAQAKMQEILKQYPNVVYLYGHHHAGDAQTIRITTNEKVVPYGTSVRLKNNAYKTDGYIYAYMGSLGYYGYTYQPSLTSDDIELVQFLLMEFYPNHITFRYYNSGEKTAVNGNREILSFTVARDLSSQMGVSYKPFDMTVAGTPDSGNNTDSASGSSSKPASKPSSGSSGGSARPDDTVNGGTPSDGPSYGNEEIEEDLIIDTEVNITEADRNFLSGNLVGAGEDLLDALLTPEEKEAAEENDFSPQVNLTVSDLAQKIAEYEKEAIGAAAGNGTVSAWFDLTLYVSLGEMGVRPVTESGKPVSVAISVPEELRTVQGGVQRTFGIVRLFDGEATLLPAKYDGATGTLVFETDVFFTVALYYTDTVMESGGGNGGTVDSSDSAETTDPAVSDSSSSVLPSDSSSGNAKNRPDSALWIWIVVGGVAALAAGGGLLVFFFLRKNVKFSQINEKEI